MQIFVLASFAIVSLISVFGGSTIITLIPDLVGAAALVAVGVGLLKQRSVSIDPKYILYFSVLAMLVVVGWAINQVPSGAMASGVRFYAKGFFFFLIPIVYKFSDKEIRQQLLLLLVIGLIQLPVAVIQRFVLYLGGVTGDVVTGTLGRGSAGLLATLLCLQIAMLTAFYVKGRMRPALYFSLMFVLFVTTTIGENKAVVVFFPLALILPYVFSGAWKKQKAQVISISAGLVVALVVFAVMYNFTNVSMVKHIEEGTGKGKSISEFVDSKTLLNYLAPKYMGTTREKPGRLDKIVFSLDAIAEDPVTFFVGFGVGSIANSPLGESFSGEHATEGEQYAKSVVVAAILLETGIIGLTMAIVLLWMVYRDASYLSRSANLVGAVALGWRVCIVLIGLAMLYVGLIGRESSYFLIAYFMGFVVAEHARERRRCRESLGEKRATSA